MSRAARVTSAWFAALLLVSLGAKIALTRVRQPDDSRLAAALAQAFAEQGFTVRVEHRQMGDVIHAARGACRMMARSGEEAGSRLPAFVASARGYGPLRFAYRGAVREAPARLRQTIEAYLQRQLAVIRIETVRPAHIAFAQTPECAGLAPDLGHFEVVLAP
ncbi:hypothetical protein OF829_06325 [Sphingomonas sp. LB-2]|uniref:hypothetical protein n=1 Tax=Sphingomonas caeni TaxID=2984949 RepID=UPI0022308CE8|nr:hypothetical protein [Sphingomonas caeni]MCW3846849.1 hypothetical protein [Sphingomonas caeni]